MDDDIGAEELRRSIERLLELRLGDGFTSADASELRDLYVLERSRRPSKPRRTSFGLEITQDTFGGAFRDEWLPL